MPTVLDFLREHLFIDDELANRLAPYLATTVAEPKTKLAPPINDIDPLTLRASEAQARDPAREPLGFLGVILGIGLRKGKVVKYLDELPPSRGYEQMLVDAGWDRVVARGMVALALQRARRRALESKWRRQVVEAVRFLTQKRQARAILTRAKLLIDVSETTTTVETIFANAGLNESEFLTLLKSVVDGREVDFRRIREIAAQISPNMAVPRGPRIRVESQAYQFFLNPEMRLPPRRRRSNYRKRAADYVSPLTAATRLEFSLADFDPRPAQRRNKLNSNPNSYFCGRRNHHN